MSRTAGYRLVAVFLLAMVCAHAVVFWQESARLSAGYGDFSQLFAAGLMLRRGEGEFLYDRDQQWTTQQEFAAGVSTRQGPLPFVRPPFEALLFTPFTYCSYPVALGLWTAVKICLLWCALRLLPRPAPFEPAYSFWVEFALSFGFFPVFLDLLQGQDVILLLFLLVAALRQLQGTKDFSAGLILALGLFKFQFVLPLALILWVARGPRLLAGFMTGAAALAAISCAITGPRALASYPVALLDLNRSTGVAYAAAHRMPNLRGLLAALSTFVPHLTRPQWLLLPAAIAVLAFVACLCRSTRAVGFPALAAGYSLALTAAILTSYYAFSHDLALFLIPVLLLSGGFLDQPQLTAGTRRLILAGLLLVIFTPLDWLLIARLDQPCLLAVPPALLGLGLIGYLRNNSAGSP